MARNAKKISSGAISTEHLSAGVLSLCFPMQEIKRILSTCQFGETRNRDLPLPVVVFFNIALCLFPNVAYENVQSWLFAGIEYLTKTSYKKCVKSAFSYARKKLGAEPMKKIFQELSRPINDKKIKGTYWKKWLLVALDGSSLSLQDTEDNRKSFGGPSNQKGDSAWPMMRFTALVEVGTHIIFDAEIDGYKSSEITLAGKLVSRLKPGMLCLADRLFPSFWLWKKTAATGCALVWRAKEGLTLEHVKTLSDGSWLAHWRPNEKDRREHPKEVHLVRVVEYKITKKNPAATEEKEESYRLITNILDPSEASAQELAELYPERWEIELSFKEIKNVMRKGVVTLRSKTPELVKQEFWSMLLAHYALRKMIVQSAMETEIDPDEISTTGALEIIKKTLAGPVLNFPPKDGEESNEGNDKGNRNPKDVKQSRKKQSASHKAEAGKPVHSAQKR